MTYYVRLSNRQIRDSHPRYISQIGCCFQNSRDGKQVDYLAVTALSLMFVSRGWKSVKHPNATLDVFKCCQKKIFTLSTWRTNWNLNIWLLQPLNASFFWDVPYKCSIKNHSKYHLSRISKKITKVWHKIEPNSFFFLSHQKTIWIEQTQT